MNLFAAAALVSTATFNGAPFVARTVGRSARLGFIRLFNNVADASVTRVTTDAADVAIAHTPGAGNREAYAFRGTNATARGVAGAGFDVYTLGGDTFVAVSNGSAVAQ